MFVDRAKIYVKAGNGGDGCVAFRREKFVPRGGPSGGNGGGGGDVLIRASKHLNTLLPFRYNQHYTAGRGRHGSGSNRAGKAGANVVLEVPLGTQVFDQADGRLLFDLTSLDQLETLARGGKGGLGNAAYASSTNQAPRQAEPGQAGEEHCLLLELKVLADVGLIGYPNAGKSTLIAAISAARPKVADYPFTTLTPNLGVLAFSDFKTLTVADIPGLIEGAHSGTGLGDHFLRHVERCKLLVHLVDVSGMGQDDPAEAVVAINRELELYDQSLAEKPQVIVASKMDSVEAERLDRLKEFCQEQGLKLIQLSAVSRQGVQELKNALAEHFWGSET